MAAWDIQAMLDEIKRQRAAMLPEDRAALERDELAAQRESWIRAMAPCEHGAADFEDCVECRGQALATPEQGEEP
jgi:hypothetical protein